MTQQTETLEIETRDRTGSRYSQRLRKNGRLPGVVYGHGTDPISIHCDHKTVVAALEHGHRVFSLTIGGSEETVMVKDLQFGYLGDNVMHIDFTRVNMNEEVTVSVSLNFIGEPEAANAAGAVVMHEKSEVHVTCKVRDIPEEIRVDLTSMEGTHLDASGIPMPAGCVLADDPDTTVVAVSIVAELPEGEAADAAGDGSTPDVIGDDKESEG